MNKIIRDKTFKSMAHT